MKKYIKALPKAHTLLLGLIFCWALMPSTVFGTERKPNIIFILADDLGIGDIGVYGQKQIQTPNIDTMAREGLTFTDFYAGSTVCAPSRCSLMTGQHTGHTIIRQNSGEMVSLRKSDVTIPKILKEAGYYNACIGKWGMGLLGSEGEPLKQGLDSFYGYVDQSHAHNFYPEFLIRDNKVEKLRNVVPNASPRGAGVATVRIDYTHTLFAEEAIKFISEKRENPFFLYLAFTLPHANNEMTKETGEGNEIPSDEPYTKMPWPQTEKNKAAMITLLDKDIGRLFSRLKELGIDNNTLVFFSSDNGPHDEGGNDPAFFASSGIHKGIKRDLYDGGIRVPMIARWPQKIAANTVSSEILALWDVLPTLADINGIPAPKECDGISFLPTLLGQKQENKHQFIYWEFNGSGSKQALRMGKWKAVRNGLSKNENAPIELYDITKDPHEDTNLASSFPEVIEAVRKAFELAHVKSEHFPLGEWEGVNKYEDGSPKKGKKKSGEAKHE